MSIVSVFGVLPFAYFFTESAGFCGHKRGIRTRVIETLSILVLLFMVISGLYMLGMAWLMKDESYFVSC